MNYKELIENTIMPGTLSANEQADRCVDLLKFVNSKIPHRLYRFRSCNERSLDSFYKDEIWFANGGEMNDDFDARIYYDRKKVKQWISSFANIDDNINILDRIVSVDSIPIEIVRKYPWIKDAVNKIKTTSRDDIKQFLKQVTGLIFDNFENELQYISNVIQRGTKFACFSEKIYSDMMWGNYAANATGFAIEYEFGKENSLTFSTGINGQNMIWCNLFPILYGNERLDATEYAIYMLKIYILKKIMTANGFQYMNQLINEVIPCPDYFMVTKLAIKKSNDWKPEKEWRLFLTSNNSDIATERFSKIVYKPSAVYLGRKISNIHQKIIMDMAKEKAIPIYKMDINNNSKKYKLIRKVIKC